MIKRVDFKGEDGRWFRVEVPLECPEEEYKFGIIIGPPDLDFALQERGWPEDLRIRLHNQLFSRKLFTYRDVARHPQDLEGALKSVLKMDMGKLQELYRQEEMGG